DLNRFGDQAERTERQVQRMGRTSSQSFSTTARSARTMTQALRSPAMRNVSLQLSQVAQQASATGDPLRALAIQLPDLTLGFGPLGIAAGVAAGALLPLAANVLGAGDNAEDLEVRLKALQDVMGEMQELTDILALSTSELRDRYGEAADQVRIFAAEQASLRLAQLNSQLQEHTTILSRAARGYFLLQDAGRNYQNTLDRIQRDFGLTAQQAERFEAALTSAASASTLQEQAAALETVFSILNDAGVAASEIPPELASALDEMISLVRETQAAEKAAGDFAVTSEGISGGIANAADEAARLATNLARAIALSPVTPGMQDEDAVMSQQVLPTSATRAGQRQAIENFNNILERQGRAARGGSSGRTEEERAYNEMLRERDRILESLKTAQDRYNEQVKIAQQLLDAKELTQEQYNEHLRQMQIELQAVEFDALQRGFESISDAIADAIVNGDDLGEAFQRVLRQIASDILSSNINQLLQRLFDVGSSGSSGGGILGRIISTIFNAKGNVISNGSVMAFAQGGVVNGPTMFPMSSGVGVMGEAGPEAIMPLKRGPNGALGVQSSGAGVSVDFVVINNAQGVDVKQREEVGPDGRRVLVAEVNSMVVQGEMTQSLQGEFGLRKAKVRR
ncbi:MAG: hypothetical protein AAFR02_00980, partial [Pseudomonadota bacterium]